MKAMMMKGMAAAASPLRGLRFRFREMLPSCAAATETSRFAGRATAGSGSQRAKRARTVDLSLYPQAQLASSRSAASAVTLIFVSVPLLSRSTCRRRSSTRRSAASNFRRHLLGFEFDQVPYLMMLCGFFLILVFVNGGFKYYINTFKGQARRADAAALPLSAVSCGCCAFRCPISARPRRRRSSR